MLKSMKPKTTTKRLELTTVALERIPMSLEEKVDARKRSVYPFIPSNRSDTYPCAD